MIEHCISVFCKNQKELQYKIYVTDALKAISENTARQLIDGGVVMSVRFFDLIAKKETTQEVKTGDQVAEEVISAIFQSR